MNKYTLIKLDQVQGDVDFFKLEINGKCYFDDFVNNARKDNKSELLKIFQRMDRIARRLNLPSTQRRKIITKQVQEVEIYEIKTKQLRVYYIIDDIPRNIIIIGGFKKTQKQDINRLINIVKCYLVEQESL
jgi:putative component of toxin-antitoxin plasmid stabilization module